MEKILVAMSGGVDSSVAAWLLKQQGHEVEGATLRLWNEDPCAGFSLPGCMSAAGIADAAKVAREIEIPHRVFEAEDFFRQEVVDYFADEYQGGRTPNPCITCNRQIKFGFFLDRAKALGFDAVASGHYARVVMGGGESGLLIAEALDLHKDQSYMLSRIRPDALARIRFPLGELTKKEVRAIAKKLKLSIHEKKESQEICFIPSNDYGRFLEAYRPEVRSPSGVERKGKVRMTDGKIMGTHPGYYHFTRGQRRGLGIPFTERLYVVSTDPASNEIVLGKKQDVLNRTFIAESMNWFLSPSERTNEEVYVKIRARHVKSKARLEILDETTVRVQFQKPQEAITPGQGAVFYRDDKVIGGGWIAQIVE